MALGRVALALLFVGVCSAGSCPTNGDELYKAVIAACPEEVVNAVTKDNSHSLCKLECSKAIDAYQYAYK